MANTVTLEVMNSEECSKYLRCHVSTLYKMVKAKTIPHFRVGKDLRYHKIAIDEWALTHSANSIEGRQET